MHRFQPDYLIDQANQLNLRTNYLTVLQLRPVLQYHDFGNIELGQKQ